MESTVGQDKHLEKYQLPDWESVELHQDGGEVLMFSGVGNEMGSSILDTLNFP